MISSLRQSSARAAIRLLALLAAAASSGCATREQSTDSFLGLITPYRIDIVQGNAVTREQVALVKPGMTRAQVRDALGTPMLTDMFHADRWDYFFTIRRPGTEPQRRSIVALFEGDVLKSLDAPDALPSEPEFVATIVPFFRTAAPRVLELTEEQRKALPLPPKRETPAGEAASPAGPVRAYPPLESK